MRLSPALGSNKIGARIVGLVALSVALVLAGFGQLTAWRDEQAIRALSERDMQRLMETVVGSIEALMLPGQAAVAQGFAERLKRVPDVVDFRILRRDGAEAFLDNATISQVNARLGASRFAPRAAERPVRVLPAGDPRLRRATAVPGRDLVRFDEALADGSRLVSFLYGIPNQPACSGCHGAEGAALGAFKLTVSMASFDARVQRSRREIWTATAAALALVLVLVSLTVRRSVVQPIQNVTRAMERAACGDLEQAVPVPRSDEIGAMAQSFNVMIERLHQVHTGLRLEQDKLHTVIQSTGEGVVVTDASGRVVLVNEAAVRLLGKRRERIVDEGFEKLLDDARIVRTLLERQSGDAPTPYKVAYKGRALRVTAATIRAKDGVPIGSAALLRDITPAEQQAA